MNLSTVFILTIQVNISNGNYYCGCTKEYTRYPTTENMKESILEIQNNAISGIGYDLDDKTEYYCRVEKFFKFHN